MAKKTTLEDLVISEAAAPLVAHKFYRHGSPTRIIGSPVHVVLTAAGLDAGLGGRDKRRYGIIVGERGEHWIVRRLGESSSKSYHKSFWQECKPSECKPIREKIYDAFTSKPISRQRKYQLRMERVGRCRTCGKLNCRKHK